MSATEVPVQLIFYMELLAISSVLKLGVNTKFVLGHTVQCTLMSIKKKKVFTLIISKVQCNVKYKCVYYIARYNLQDAGREIFLGNMSSKAAT